MCLDSEHALIVKTCFKLTNIRLGGWFPETGYLGEQFISFKLGVLSPGTGVAELVGERNDAADLTTIGANLFAGAY